MSRPKTKVNIKHFSFRPLLGNFSALEIDEMKLERCSFNHTYKGKVSGDFYEWIGGALEITLAYSEE